MDSEISPYGYWISPEGEVHPMPSLQVHGRWMLERNPSPGLDATGVKEKAVAEGWLGVTIPPVGDEWGLSVRRDDTVDVRQASAFRDVLIAHEHMALPVRAGFDVLPGSEMVQRLRLLSRDPTRWPDAADEAAEALSGRDRSLRSLASARGELAALRAGREPDLETARALLEGMRARAKDAHRDFYDLSGKLLFGSLPEQTVEAVRAAVAHAEPVLSGHLEALARDTEDARHALFGEPLPPESPPSPVAPGSVFEARRAAADVVDAYKALYPELKEARAAAPAAKEREAMYFALVDLKTAVTLLAGNMARLREAAADDALPFDKMKARVSFYSGHENGAGCHKLLVQRVPHALRRLAEFRTALASPAPDAVPAP